MAKTTYELMGIDDSPSNRAKRQRRQLQKNKDLLSAANSGGLATLKSLLSENVANVNAQDSRGYTALCFTIIKGHFDCAELLLRNNANPNIYNSYGRTPVFYAIAKRQEIRFLELLLKHKADPNLDESNSWIGIPTPSPLHFIVATVHMGLGKYIPVLLEYKVDVDTPDGESLDTPLHLAARNDDIKTLQLLIPHAKKLNWQNLDGWTILHWAAKHGHLNLVKQLLNYGASPNIRYGNKIAFELTSDSDIKKLLQSPVSETRTPTTENPKETSITLTLSEVKRRLEELPLLTDEKRSKGKDKKKAKERRQKKRRHLFSRKKKPKHSISTQPTSTTENLDAKSVGAVFKYIEDHNQSHIDLSTFTLTNLGIKILLSLIESSQKNPNITSIKLGKLPAALSDEDTQRLKEQLAKNTTLSRIEIDSTLDQTTVHAFAMGSIEATKHFEIIVDTSHCHRKYQETINETHLLISAIHKIETALAKKEAASDAHDAPTSLPLLHPDESSSKYTRDNVIILSKKNVLRSLSNGLQKYNLQYVSSSPLTQSNRIDEEKISEIIEGEVSNKTKNNLKPLYIFIMHTSGQTNSFASLDRPREYNGCPLYLVDSKIQINDKLCLKSIDLLENEISEILKQVNNPEKSHEHRTNKPAVSSQQKNTGEQQTSFFGGLRRRFNGQHKQTKESSDHTQTLNQ